MFVARRKMKRLFKKMSPQTRKALLEFCGVGLLVAVAVFFSTRIADSQTIQALVSGFGYGGVFALAAASGFNILFPIPAISFIELFLAAGFSFAPLIVVISLGMSIGDSIGFLLGKVGAHIAEHVDKKTHPRIQQLLNWLHAKQKQYRTLPYIILFFYVAFAPIPNEGLVIPMAFAGYKFRYMLPVIVAGNILFNITVATGILSLVNVVG